MKPVKYYIGNDIYLENRDPEDRFGHGKVWAITRHGSCFNTELEWEWEPMPSSRDEEYLNRNRYTFEDAVKMVKSGYFEVVENLQKEVK